MAGAGTGKTKDQARREIIQYLKDATPIIKEVSTAREEWVAELAQVSELLHQGKTGPGFRRAADIGRMFRTRFEGAGIELDSLRPPTPGTEQCHKLLCAWIDWQIKATHSLSKLAQESDANYLAQSRAELEKARTAAVAFGKAKDHLLAQYGITVRRHA